LGAPNNKVYWTSAKSGTAIIAENIESAAIRKRRCVCDAHMFIAATWKNRLSDWVGREVLSSHWTERAYTIIEEKCSGNERNEVRSAIIAESFRKSPFFIGFYIFKIILSNVIEIYTILFLI